VGALAYNTQIFVNEAYQEPLFLYSIIGGLPSTKKSRCARMIKEQFVELQKNHSNAVTLNNSNRFIYQFFSV
jgi:hypothetical protein